MFGGWEVWGLKGFDVGRKTSMISLQVIINGVV
jgi:hypothetical protein